VIRTLVLPAALALMSVACSPGSTSSPSASIPGITLTPCALSSPGTPTRLNARCGTLTVFEDRAAGTGRKIDLNVAVVKAASRSAEPDPLFFLAGGPGQAATESAVQMSGAFSRIAEKRDVVLVDQRGTGKSHPLRCPEAAADAGLSEPGAQTLTDEEITSALRGCLAQMDADPALYTTPIAMEDLDEVREALGYEKINLYGVSYGTRAALTYIRQYPDRVRTAILDGVWPPGIALTPEVGANAQRALDAMFDRCAADAACNGAFPKLRSEFDSVLSTLRRQPVKLTVTHPITAEPTEMTFTADGFGLAVRMLSYSTETTALLPLLIHTTQSTGDFRLLAVQSLMVSEDLSDSIAEGMDFSVVCAEDEPYFTPEDAARESGGSYLGSSTADSLVKICSVWPRGTVPADYMDPVRSDVPVLLLSGEFDPITPPSNAESAATTLPNSLHLIAPGQGHGVIFRGCVPKVATSFVENGGVAGLATGCVKQIGPAPFFTTYAGPKP
jgi:pimeloyl-ACP methyl ester carboxylesterase